MSCDFLAIIRCASGLRHERGRPCLSSGATNLTSPSRKKKKNLTSSFPEYLLESGLGGYCALENSF
ncbi:hypothetical protein PAHAL_5G246600 [Panicum hallii]|jgi:hypothetical protein|uniref:Uncharacterized protein n=1 Tax=Panicum hallii TaxID=206008 RepID=A0A2T8IL19_9POAL|nr:hypothetical protein PAHAL_5G246600 [Panicum hallii]